MISHHKVMTCDAFYGITHIGAGFSFRGRRKSRTDPIYMDYLPIVSLACASRSGIFNFCKLFSKQALQWTQAEACVLQVDLHIVHGVQAFGPNRALVANIIPARLKNSLLSISNPYPIGPTVYFSETSCAICLFQRTCPCNNIYKDKTAGAGRSYIFYSYLYPNY